MRSFTASGLSRTSTGSRALGHGTPRSSSWQWSPRPKRISIDLHSHHLEQDNGRDLVGAPNSISSSACWPRREITGLVELAFDDCRSDAALDGRGAGNRGDEAACCTPSGARCDRRISDRKWEQPHARRAVRKFGRPISRSGRRSCRPARWRRWRVRRSPARAWHAKSSRFRSPHAAPPSALRPLGAGSNARSIPLVPPLRDGTTITRDLLRDG